MLSAYGYRVRRALISAFLFVTPLFFQTSAAQTAQKPNVVVILVDDAAFMDFGGFGGEARTPNINMIADRGVRFSNYRTSPLCSPSRAMLLTGLDNHRTGMGTIPEIVTAKQLGQDGYLMRLKPEIETLAERLRGQGYQTFMTGKWHLGSEHGDLPVDHGFDRSFALDASGADNWEEKSYMPYYDEAPWYEDGSRSHLPDEFYSSDFIVDKMVEYLKARDEREAPFLSYLAFQAIHIPVQAPKELTDSYAGVYEAGWDALRRTRWERAKELGLIGPDAPLAEMPAGLRKWEDLTSGEKAIAVRSMQVNAAMLEAMDQALGRLFGYLKETGEFENTLFVITSDNGPEFSDPVHQPFMNIWMALNGYHYDLDTLGEKRSLNFIGAEWAAAASSPGALFKFFTSEGGIHVPMIVSGTGVEISGFTDHFTMVTDITPTIMELVTGQAPDRSEFSGRSLMRVLSGGESAAAARAGGVGMEVSGNAAFFEGDFKLLKTTGPYGNGDWRLYDIKADPGETNDLSVEYPEKLAAMQAGYEVFAEDVGVIDPPEGFDVVMQVRKTAMAKQRARYKKLILPFIGGILIFGGLIFLFFRSGKRGGSKR